MKCVKIKYVKIKTFHLQFYSGKSRIFFFSEQLYYSSGNPETPCGTYIRFHSNMFYLNRIYLDMFYLCKFEFMHVSIYPAFHLIIKPLYLKHKNFHVVNTMLIHYISQIQYLFFIYIYIYSLVSTFLFIPIFIIKYILFILIFLFTYFFIYVRFYLRMF